MFEHIQPIPPDPILGIIAAHAADPNPKKIDLGIGVYRDESGNTPILNCVRKAEEILLATQTSKVYLGPPGVARCAEPARRGHAGGVSMRVLLLLSLILFPGLIPSFWYCGDPRLG